MSYATGPSKEASTSPRLTTQSAKVTANDPFHTPFDNDHEDDEWWNDEKESPILTPENSPSLSRMTQWPTTIRGGVETTRRITQRSVHKPVKRYSVQKPTREKSRQRQKMKNAAAGIKVITNVSRHRGPPPVPQQPSLPSQAPSNILQPGCFIDLAALQALDGQAPNATRGLWKSIKGIMPSKAETVDVLEADTQRDLSNMGSREADSALERLGSRRGHGLRPPPLNLDADLSPSDRPIVIGISIPSARLTQHATSPQTAFSDTSTILQSASTLGPNESIPETPAIIITPSQNTSNWFSQSQKDTMSQRRPRATSSVYSRTTNFFSASHEASDRPPMPPMPVSALRKFEDRVQKARKSVRHSAGTIFSEDGDIASARKSRAVSSYTVFEEDESPILSRKARAVSVSEGIGIIKHTSVTVPDQRLSKGWWSYITTPFLTRSNTLASPSSISQEHPALPVLAMVAPEEVRDVRDWEKSYFSPMSPPTSTTIASDIWWDKQTIIDPGENVNSPDEESGTLPFMLAAGAGTLLSMSGHSMDQDNNMNGGNQPVTTTLTSHISPLGPIIQSMPSNPAHPNVRLLPEPIRVPVPPSQRQDLNRAVVQPNPHVGSMINPVSTTNSARFTPGLQSSMQPSPQPPPYSPPRDIFPRYHAVFPQGHRILREPPSPGPITPGLQHAMSSRGGIALSDVPLTPAPRRPINLNSGYPGLPERGPVVPITAADIGQASKKAKKAEAKRLRHEKEDVLAHKVGGLWRGRGCIPKRGCYGRSGAEGRKRRRCWFWLVAGFLSMIILIIVLATTLHRSPAAVVGQSQWLNLTGFPPIFTGVSTVAVPDNPVSNSVCAFPSTMWSCSLPKELQSSVAPNQPNQPNLRLQIQWDNSSIANATFVNVTGNPNLPTRVVRSNTASAGQLIRSMLLKARQALTPNPSPAPPSYAEQLFLGNTTDGIISDGKAGEPTPFYISFLSTTVTKTVTNKLLKRDNSTSPFSNITDQINSNFPPEVNSDGTAAPANLLPLPLQQPLRLYDRGLDTEHYGFYTYFNRSIFLKSDQALDASNLVNGEVLDDRNGGCTASAAKLRCTWSETRFLVQMWTRKGSTAPLNNATVSSQASSVNFTANDFIRPGSFPYPITITTDRHGGNPTRKSLFCYGLDNRQTPILSQAKVHPENKDKGGVLINQGFGDSDPSQNTLGGFDGGTSGCSCQWANWR